MDNVSRDADALEISQISDFGINSEGNSKSPLFSQRWGHLYRSDFMNGALIAEISAEAGPDSRSLMISRWGRRTISKAGSRPSNLDWGIQILTSRVIRLWHCLSISSKSVSETEDSKQISVRRSQECG